MPVMSQQRCNPFDEISLFGAFGAQSCYRQLHIEQWIAGKKKPLQKL